MKVYRKIKMKIGKNIMKDSKRFIVNYQTKKKIRKNKKFKNNMKKKNKKEFKREKYKKTKKKKKKENM